MCLIAVNEIAENGISPSFSVFGFQESMFFMVNLLCLSRGWRGAGSSIFENHDRLWTICQNSQEFSWLRNHNVNSFVSERQKEQPQKSILSTNCSPLTQNAVLQTRNRQRNNNINNNSIKTDQKDMQVDRQAVRFAHTNLPQFLFLLFSSVHRQSDQINRSVGRSVVRFHW